jgi:uncharacterized protein (DUF58 family)
VNRLAPADVSAPAQSAGKIPFAFGRRFFLLLFVGLIWIAPAWKQPRFLYAMALWDVLTLALWAYDLNRLPRPGQLQILRVWKEPLGLAQKSQVTIEVRNSSNTTISAQINDESPITFSREIPTATLTVPAVNVSNAAYTIQPTARGDAHFGDVWLRYNTPLRIAERRARTRLAQTVRVYPSLDQAGKTRIYLIRSRQIELEKRLKRQRGHGREFESLREYRAGDEFRDISWSATARRGKLITKVHQIERSQTLWIVLDAGRLLRARVDTLTKLDYAVNGALNLAQVALYSGDRVGLLAYGREPQQRIAPGRGMLHLRTLLEALSQVRAEASEADHRHAAEILLTQQGRRSLIVWLTDIAETPATPEVIECAATMATRHLVVLGIMTQTDLRQLVAARPENALDMYRYTAALEILQRRDLLLRRVRQQGAMALEAAPAGLSTAVMNQYLEVKERSLL